MQKNLSIVGLSVVVLAGSAIVFYGRMARQPATPSAGGVAGAQRAPADPAAARAMVEAFVGVVNDPVTSSLERFEGAYASKVRAARADIPERVRRARELQGEIGQLVIEKVMAGADGSVSAQVKADAGLLFLGFVFSDTEPGKVDSIQISDKPETGPPQAVTAQQRASVIAGVLKAMEQGYVFPEKTKAMGDAVRAKEKAGGYDTIRDEEALARSLTDDLQAVDHDRHIGVFVSPESSEEGEPGMPTLAEMRRENFAFKKIEVLPGNVGYLRFDAFAGVDEAKAVATSAMTFLANCQSLVIDLRQNGGGDPAMVQFITSYLFDAPVHLNSMIDRDGKTVEEFWSLQDVPGKKMRKDLPVFVLTAKRTFSGAEEFSYNLKALHRATLVGETTGGGAHPVRTERVNDRFVVRVPFMRANNPSTKTNWEGTGVTPDVACKADEALDKALALARKR